MVDPPLPPLPTDGKQPPAQHRKSRQPIRPARQNPIAPKRKQKNKAARRQQEPPNPDLDQQKAMAEMAESLLQMMMEALIPQEAPLVVEDDPLPEEMELHPLPIPIAAPDVLRRARANVRDGYYVRRGRPTDPPQKLNQYKKCFFLEGRWDEQDVAQARALLVSYLQSPQEDNLIQQPQQ